MGVHQAQVFECDYAFCTRQEVVPGIHENDVPPGWVLIDVLHACGAVGQAIDARALIFCGHNHAREWFTNEIRPVEAAAQEAVDE